MKTRIEKKKSSKGNDYYVLIVELIPGYEKEFFLDKADVKLIELSNSVKN